jgi:hypothetical protein
MTQLEYQKEDVRDELFLKVLMTPSIEKKQILIN